MVTIVRSVILLTFFPFSVLKEEEKQIACS